MQKLEMIYEGKAKRVYATDEAELLIVDYKDDATAFIAPCFYGTDIDSADGLIANHHTVPEIAKLIGANSLGYLSLEHAGLLTGEDSGFCMACFSGDYPTEIPAPGSKSRFERRIHEQ